MIRSVRNNNPGNIRASGIPWQGLMPRSRMNQAQLEEKSFCVFESPAYGFRAMGRVLLSYQRKHGLDTVCQIIDRWAPPIENDTGSYTNAVAKSIGVSPDQRINLEQPTVLSPLMKAITTHETGGWYGYWDDGDLRLGVSWALGRRE